MYTGYFRDESAHRHDNLKSMGCLLFACREEIKDGSMVEPRQRFSHLHKEASNNQASLITGACCKMAFSPDLCIMLKILSYCAWIVIWTTFYCCKIRLLRLEK